MEATDKIEQLQKIIAILRDPNCGCLWDKKQTFQSLIPYTIEEAYEVADAAHRENTRDLCEELGDLLLQVVYYARIAEEMQAFTLADSVRSINAKLIRRHPHIFAQQNKKQHKKLSEAELKQQWQTVKEQENLAKNTTQNHYLDTVSTGLPPILEAVRLQEKAEQTGFDWQEPLPVLQKLREELDEFQEALAEHTPAEQQAEFGDILFSLINLGRKTGINLETALKQTNQKFRRRFNYIEDNIHRYNKNLQTADIDIMEALWQEAKKQEAF